MKKLLIGLLSLMIVLVGFRLFGLKNEETTTTPTVIPTIQPIIEAEITEVEKVVKDDLPYAPIEVDNVTDYKTSWYTMSSDGYLELKPTYDKMDVSIYSLGTTYEGNQLYRDGVKYVQNEEYTISFDISATSNRKVTLFAGNGDTQGIMQSYDINVTPETKHYDFSYHHSSETIWNGRLGFFLGNDGSAENQVTTISNLRIKSSINDLTVKVNQLGYLETSQKRCVFPYNQGDLFVVINDDTQEVVYTGAIVKEIKNPLTNETNYYGDFTNLVTPGRYHIESQTGGGSYQFIISNDIFDNVIKALVKGISCQRCGMDLPEEIYGIQAHKACHNKEATIYAMPDKVLATGGWHDAGDFGRYVKTGSKAVVDILLAYMENPTIFNDDMGIIESGNGKPDILDEAKYELDWLMKMQMQWGEVFSKEVTPNLPGSINPADDTMDLVLLPSETTATADAAGALAVGYLAFKDIDQEYANLCLERSKLSWDNLLHNASYKEEDNPADIIAGDYRDDDDSDERFFASMALWAATKEDKYYDYAIEQFKKGGIDGISYTNMGAYGKYLFLSQSESTSKADYETIKKSMIDEATAVLHAAQSDGYNTGIYNYEWGSNGAIAEAGNLMVLAYNLTGDQQFKQMAVEQLNYIFGKNTLNMSFVSGFGHVSPKNVHHRLSESKDATIIGVLVGGPNGSREDSVTSTIDINVPATKVYVDTYESYSTNEMSIYWNSALIYLLALIS